MVNVESTSSGSAVLVRERRDARDVEHVEARDCRASRRTGAASPGGSRRATRRGRADRRTSSRCRSAAACSRAGCASRRRARATRRCGCPRPAASTIARCSAACPLAVAIAPTPPSSAAMRSSSTAHGRIGDARVDVPRALHVEQRRGVVAVGEDERRASGRSASRARRSPDRARAPACSDSVSKRCVLGLVIGKCRRVEGARAGSP